MCEVKKTKHEFKPCAPTYSSLLYLGADGLQWELVQAEEEGRDVSRFTQRVEEVLQIDDLFEREQEANKIYDEIMTLPIRDDYPHSTAETLEEIQSEREGYETFRKSLSEISDIEDKVLGGWLGRSAGCLLGKPVEGWHRERIVGLAKDTGNYPLSQYLRSDVGEELRQRYNIVDRYPHKSYGTDVCGWVNNVTCAPVDDDTNYTILGLKIVEEYGKDFTPENVALSWIDNIPGMHCMTAERIGYRNLLCGIAPPASGRYRNPYREWIGAQIRADFYGYANPGNPEKAAEMAWSDAVVAQVRNGVYGEMFVAAMLAWAYCAKDMLEVIHAGLSQIPKNSRLHKKISEVISWYEDGIEVQEAIRRIHEQWNEKTSHHWCHVISNAMIVAMALLFCDNDYSKAIAMAVEAGFDTDCNGATVGSVMGIFNGTKVIDEKWTTPLNNRVQSTIPGYAEVEFTELAKRTINVIYT